MIAARRTRPARTRAGYTLLELLLASAIALVVLAAVYAALNITLIRMDRSRDQIATNDLSRAVINRMTVDLAAVLGPLPPNSGGANAPTNTGSSASGSSSSSGSSTGTVTATTTGGVSSLSSSSSSSSSTSSTSGSSTDSSSQATTVGDPNLPFAAGILGTNTQLTVFVSRVPVALTDLEAFTSSTSTGIPLPSDLSRVTYYLADDGSGLCRQERPWITADGVGNLSDPDYTTETTDVIAPEVTDVVFEYFDGIDWQQQWDGTTMASDGVSLTGPPRAVRVTLTMSLRGGSIQKTIQHVFPVRAAVGLYVPALDEQRNDDER